jgi:Fe-S-cluster containining protein
VTLRASPETELLAQLEALFADADALMAGWSCDASTLCCRFGVTGREPYVTSIELALLERGIAARGGRLPLRRRALPLADEKVEQWGGRRAKVERTCPLLDARGRCAVYASRPLGCRTFFCDRAVSTGRMPREEIRQLVARIEDLAARHRPDGDRARPLGRYLGV